MSSGNVPSQLLEAPWQDSARHPFGDAERIGELVREVALQLTAYTLLGFSSDRAMREEMGIPW